MIREVPTYFVEWDITAYKNYGTPDQAVSYHEVDKNVVVDDGRKLALYDLFALAGSNNIGFLASGACSTAAAHTDTRLNYEHILNTTRKSLTNTSSAPLSASDVVADNFTDTSVGIPGANFYYKIVCQASYNGATDANVNQPFQEYALSPTGNCPGTPTGTSGIIFNHYVAQNPVILDSATTLVVQVTIRT